MEPPKNGTFGTEYFFPLFRFSLKGGFKNLKMNTAAGYAWALKSLRCILVYSPVLS